MLKCNYLLGSTNWLWFDWSVSFKAAAQLLPSWMQDECVEDYTMAAAGHAAAFSLRLELSVQWVFTVISNALTCMRISVWIVLRPRFGFEWNFNDRIMSERETSMTHSHRSITLSALHHTAVTPFASEGPRRPTSYTSVGLLGMISAIKMCWQWDE